MFDHHNPTPAPAPAPAPAPETPEAMQVPAGRGLWHHRSWSGLTRTQRLRLQTDRDDLLHNLSHLDQQIDQLTKTRLQTLATIDERREQLWPIDPSHKGRRPPAVDEAPIPPAQPNARPVAGRCLRAACRSILRQHGPLTLRQLHTWLHHYGYKIDTPWPTKRLADAMAYETNLGRLQRITRATYAIADNDTTTRWFRNQEPPLTDPWIDVDQPNWAGYPGFLAPLRRR